MFLKATLSKVREKQNEYEVFFFHFVRFRTILLMCLSVRLSVIFT